MRLSRCASRQLCMGCWCAHHLQHPLVGPHEHQRRAKEAGPRAALLGRRRLHVGARVPIFVQARQQCLLECLLLFGGWRRTAGTELRRSGHTSRNQAHLMQNEHTCYNRRASTLRRHVLLCVQLTALPQDVCKRRCSGQRQLHTRQNGVCFGARQSWRWACCLAGMQRPPCDVQAASIHCRRECGLQPPPQHQPVLPAQPCRHLTSGAVTASQGTVARVLQQHLASMQRGPSATAHQQNCPGGHQGSIVKCGKRWSAIHNEVVYKGDQVGCGQGCIGDGRDLPRCMSCRQIPPAAECRMSAALRSSSQHELFCPLARVQRVAMVRTA